MPHDGTKKEEERKGKKPHIPGGMRGRLQRGQQHPPAAQGRADNIMTRARGVSGSDKVVMYGPRNIFLCFEVVISVGPAHRPSFFFLFIFNRLYTKFPVFLGTP